MITISHLTKNFTNVKAVNNLDLSLDKGIHALVGHNGAGKSTLLRLIADVYQPSEGTILIDNVPNNDISSKKNVFYLSDNPYVLLHSNPLQTFNFYSALFDLDKDRFVSLLNKLQLPLDRRVSTFSKGMRRQLFLCIALSFKGDYLLLDEAFDGVDPIIQEIIKEVIIEMGNDKTFIISSHNISSLERLCDDFIILHKGSISKQGDSFDMGTSFKKYQIIFKDNITKEQLIKDGFSIVSFKKAGSITNIVIDDDSGDKIKDKYQPTLMEPIAIEPDEVVALQMLIAKEKEDR